MSIYYAAMITTFLIMLMVNVYLLSENRRIKQKEKLWREISDMQTNNLLTLTKFAIEISSELGDFENSGDNIVQFVRR